MRKRLYSLVMIIAMLIMCVNISTTSYAATDTYTFKIKNNKIECYKNGTKYTEKNVYVTGKYKGKTTKAYISNKGYASFYIRKNRLYKYNTRTKKYENKTATLKSKYANKSYRVSKASGMYFYVNKDGEIITSKGWKINKKGQYAYYVGNKGYITYKIYKDKLQEFDTTEKKFSTVSLSKNKNSFKKVGNYKFYVNKYGKIDRKAGWKTGLNGVKYKVGNKGTVTETRQTNSNTNTSTELRVETLNGRPIIRNSEGFDVTGEYWGKWVKAAYTLDGSNKVYEFYVTDYDVFYYWRIRYDNGCESVMKLENGKVTFTPDENKCNHNYVHKTVKGHYEEKQNSYTAADEVRERGYQCGGNLECRMVYFLCDYEGTEEEQIEAALEAKKACHKGYSYGTCDAGFVYSPVWWYTIYTEEYVPAYEYDECSICGKIDNKKITDTDIKENKYRYKVAYKLGSENFIEVTEEQFKQFFKDGKVEKGNGIMWKDVVKILKLNQSSKDWN